MLINGLGRSWKWPDSDQMCRAVVFDWAKDINVAIKHCRQRRTAIQAGGNMGVWPWLLAQQFDMVVTAEPEPECFQCLTENVSDARVIKIEAAFGEVGGSCNIEFDRHGKKNMGAQYMVAGDNCKVITIDSLGVDDCDLIYLDIEGAEMSALRGAVNTIALCKPVIVVEDKGLSDKFGTKKGDIERWLADAYGYKVVARPHRDVVMTC